MKRTPTPGEAAHLDSLLDQAKDEFARQLAKDILIVAYLGGIMPGDTWLTDQRIARACAVLGWTPQRARAWAQEQTP